MDTGKNKMVGMRKKRALRGTLFAGHIVLLP